MKITVTFFGLMRRPWPQVSREIEVPDHCSLSDLVQQLGYTDQEMKWVQIVIDGEKCSPETTIKPDQEVNFLLMSGGG